MRVLKSDGSNFYNDDSNNFWSDVPIVSLIIIITVLLVHIGYFFDADRTADTSFYRLISPSLDEVRNGRYWGLVTSSLLENNMIFLFWGIGWLVYFGLKIERYVPRYSYILLILSALIVPELVQILVLQSTSDGLGGLFTTCCGLLWFRSEFSQSEWYFSTLEKVHFGLFIFLCILVNFTGIYQLAIPGLIGGFIWGLLLGFITTFKSIIVRASVPPLIFGILLVPVFWAPWQPSWLVNQAEKQEKLSNIEEAKEIYRNALAKNKNYQPAVSNLTNILYKEFALYYDQEEYEKAKEPLLQTLEIDPSNESAKKNLQLTNFNILRKEAYEYHDQGVVKDDEKKYKEAEKLFKEAERVYSEMLAIDPDDESTKENLQVIKRNLEDLPKR